MANEPDNLVLRILSALQEDSSEIKRGLTNLEQGQSNISMQVSNVQSMIAHVQASTAVAHDRADRLDRHYGKAVRRIEELERTLTTKDN